MYPPENLKAPRASKNMCYPFLDCTTKNKIKHFKHTGFCSRYSDILTKVSSLFPCLAGGVHIYLKTNNKQLQGTCSLAILN